MHPVSKRIAAHPSRRTVRDLPVMTAAPSPTLAMHAAYVSDVVGLSDMTAQQIELHNAWHVAPSLSIALPLAESFHQPGTIEQRKAIDDYNAQANGAREQLHQPAWQEVGRSEDSHFAEHIKAATQNIGFPAILKSDHGAYKHVLQHADDVAPAVAAAVPGTYLLEAMLEGPGASLQATVTGGRMQLHSIRGEVMRREAAEMTALGQKFVDAIAYRNGPLHLAFAGDVHGRKHLIEAGFQLSDLASGELRDLLISLARNK